MKKTPFTLLTPAVIAKERPAAATAAILPRPRKKPAFTLAEVLITLAIIGIVAALTIPSVITNYQQQEFKTGLKKAVSVLNSAITTSIALDGESPYDNADLFNYLQRHMNVMKSTHGIWMSRYLSPSGSVYNSWGNDAFYTTDGMRFEFDDTMTEGATTDGTLLKLHESDIHACFALSGLTAAENPEEYLKDKKVSCGGCGSLGLKENPNQTTKPPCAILVDVNGDKKPTPANAKCMNTTCARTENTYSVPLPDSKILNDIFVILITEDRAIPYGVAAQRAMYGTR